MLPLHHIISRTWNFRGIKEMHSKHKLSKARTNTNNIYDRL